MFDKSKIYFAMLVDVNIKQLGKVLKFIRESKHFSLEGIATQAGYMNSSPLCKIEKGEVHTIDIERLQKICNALECDFALVIEFARTSVTLQFSINTWDGFFASVAKMKREDQNKMLDYIRDIFPNKYIEFKAKLSIG